MPPTGLRKSRNEVLQRYCHHLSSPLQRKARYGPMKSLHQSLLTSHLGNSTTSSKTPGRLCDSGRLRVFCRACYRTPCIKAFQVFSFTCEHCWHDASTAASAVHPFHQFTNQQARNDECTPAGSTAAPWDGLRRQMQN